MAFGQMQFDERTSEVTGGGGERSSLGEVSGTSRGKEEGGVG